MLRSTKDENLYFGFTGDLKLRLKQHNDGKVSSTSPRKPFVLVYFEACLDKQKAIAREKYFKSGFGRAFLKNRI